MTAPFLNKKSPLSRTRSFFWPIHGYEMKKFLPMAIMMFLVLFNYTILRNTKDALIVTLCGPEVIPFLKGLLIMPISIFFVALYAKCLNVYKVETVFYLAISLFISFFAFFSLFLYPNHEFLEPSPEKILALKITYPSLQHLISVYGNWVASIFYIFSELWGTLVLGLLFWQFANEITRIAEAKRFYPMFAFLGHFGLIAAGLIMVYLCKFQSIGKPGVKMCSSYLNDIMLTVIVASLLIMAIYRWMNLKVLTNIQYYDAASKDYKKNYQRPKYSLRESFKHVINSPYIGLISILVLGYGFSNNILSLIWKKQIKLQYDTVVEYSQFMANFSSILGIVTVILIYFFKGTVLRFGWLSGALVTPIFLAITGSIFFYFIFFGDKMSSFIALFMVTPLFFTLIIGTVQQVLSKCAKYSMFDPTKEMAYIPLDPDLKTRGKAAVDVIGHTFSKASSGYVVGGLLILTQASDLMFIAPYLAGLIAIMIVVWILATQALYKRYKILLAQKSAKEESLSS